MERLATLGISVWEKFVHKWGEGRMAGYAAPVLKQAVDDSDGYGMNTA